VFLEAGELREFYEQGSVFLVCKPEGLDCKYYVIEDSFELFLSDYLLSLHTFLFLLVWM
jgi:hypothetical protein